jgi:hypothetical protein
MKVEKSTVLLAGPCEYFWALLWPLVFRSEGSGMFHLYDGFVIRWEETGIELME